MRQRNLCFKEISELYVLMFADDISSFSDTVLRLQKQIDCISDYTKIKGMKINADKTKIVVFRNGGIVKKTERWFFDGKPLEIVPFYKYLGVNFTPKLSWSVTLDKLSLQATKASYNIFRYQKKFGNI